MKIIINEDQLNFIVKKVSVQEQIRKKIKARGAFYIDRNKKVGQRGFTSEISETDIKQSFDWLGTNMTDDLLKEFQKKIVNPKGKKLFSQWLDTYNSAKSANVQFTKENITENNYDSIYYLKMCFEEYIKLKSTSKRKIRKISIYDLGDKVEQIPAEKQEPFKPKYIEASKDLFNTDEVKPFEDNMSEPTEYLIQNINEVVTKLQETLNLELQANPKLKELYSTNPEYFTWTCIDLAVSSSASRYSNTGVASNLNFLTLSRDRAVNGYKKITEIFSQNGINFGSEFEQNSTSDPSSIDYFGTNGDGSSGPPPRYGNRLADPNSEGTIDTPPNYISSEDKETYDDLWKFSVKAYGKPERKKSDYNQYKYFKFVCKFELNVNVPPKPPEPPEPTEKRIENYKIVFFRNKFTWNLKIDLGLTLPRLNFGRLRSSDPSKCPRWGKGIKKQGKWVKKLQAYKKTKKFS